MPKLNWKTIIAEATAWAEKHGHELEPFGRSIFCKMPSSRGLEMLGSCWVSFVGDSLPSSSSVPRFRTGGRLLFYDCGTPEAAGTKGIFRKYSKGT
jgi:hypothetical protein